jgi:hypothetical protein
MESIMIDAWPYNLVFSFVFIVGTSLAFILWENFRPLTDEENDLLSLFSLAISKGSYTEVCSFSYFNKPEEYTLSISCKSFVISKRLGKILTKIQNEKNKELKNKETEKNIKFLRSKFENKDE